MLAQTQNFLAYNLPKFANLRNFFAQKNNIYLIYTMGKVASSSIYATLSYNFPLIPIFHAHVLSPHRIHKSPDVYQKHAPILQYLQKNTTKKIKIITLVREPIARGMSSFFENPHRQGVVAAQLPNYTPAQIFDLITQNNQDQNSQNFTTAWFDVEFQPFTNFNIYQHLFDTEKGYAMYEHENMSILVLKVEQLHSTWQPALSQFCNYNFKKMVDTNETQQKLQTNLYKAVKQAYKLPAERLQALYSTPYMQHFYTPTEIEQFTKQWQLNK